MQGLQETSVFGAYDRAAIKFRGVDADINFELGDYDEEMKQMKVLNKEEFVHILCCQSTGLAPSDMFSSILMTSSRTNVEFEGEAGEPSFRRLVLWSVAYIIRIRLFYSSSLITECTSTTVQFRFSSCRAREDTFKHYLLDRISSNCTSLTTSEFNECFSVTNVSDFSVICSLNFDNQLMFLFRALKEKTSLRFG